MSPTVIQVPLEVPPEIMEGIQRGIYNLIGGVARNLDGTIVKLLNDAAPTDAVEHVAATVKQAVKNAPVQMKNPWVIGASLVGTVVVATVAVAILTKKQAKNQAESDSSEMKEVPVPTSIASYRASLRAYLDASRSGTLTAGIISDLLEAASTVRTQSNGGMLALDFEAEESQTLVSLVVGYTRSLADANSLSLEDLLPSKESDGALDELLRHLEAQRRIFAPED